MIALLATLLILGVCVAAGDVSRVDLEPTLRVTLATR